MCTFSNILNTTIASRMLTGHIICNKNLKQTADTIRTDHLAKNCYFLPYFPNYSSQDLVRLKREMRLISLHFNVPTDIQQWQEFHSRHLETHRAEKLALVQFTLIISTE